MSLLVSTLIIYISGKEKANLRLALKQIFKLPAAVDVHGQAEVMSLAGKIEGVKDARFYQ